MPHAVVHTDDFGGSFAVRFADKLIPIRYRTDSEAHDVLFGLLGGLRPTTRGYRHKMVRDAAMQRGEEFVAAYGLA